MAECPRELLADPAVPWNAKACASLLWSLVRRDDPNPRWWQTFAKLAEQLGCTERQARRAHEALVAAGWASRRAVESDTISRWETVLHREPHPAARCPESGQQVAFQNSEHAAREEGNEAAREGGSEARCPDPRCPPDGQALPAERADAAREEGRPLPAERLAEAPREPQGEPEVEPQILRYQEIAPDQTALAVTGEPTALVLVEPPANDDIATLRTKAAKAVWRAHEQARVDLLRARRAAGGGLREPTDEDIAALKRCATKLRKQENLDEGGAWRMLRAAAIASVEAAARARANGRESAEQLVEYRRVNPFGGKKLGHMLAELERATARGGLRSDLTEQQALAWARKHGDEAPDGWEWTGDGRLVRAEEVAADG